MEVSQSLRQDDEYHIGITRHICKGDWKDRLIFQIYLESKLTARTPNAPSPLC